MFEFWVIKQPYQPRSKGAFPKRKLGQKKTEHRSFQPFWFDNKLCEKWLHWETRNNRAYCIICRNVHPLKQFTLFKSKESTFITTGFNWKDATHIFEQHRKSACHKEAVMKWDQINKDTSINSQLQHQLQSQQEKARNCLLKLFTSIAYLAHQGLPLHSHLEHNGNFHQLMQLRANDFNDLVAAKKSLYISWNPRWDAQDYVSSNIKVDIKRCLYQQVVQCECWWDCWCISDRAGIYKVIHTYNPQTYEVYEDCIGLYSTNETTVNQLTCLIKDVLTHSSLPLNNCCGQCYDGAANMSGRHSGVATQIQQLEARALYMHCMGHCLNLAVQDTCRSITIMRDDSIQSWSYLKSSSTVQRKKQCL